MCVRRVDVVDCDRLNDLEPLLIIHQPGLHQAVLLRIQVGNGFAFQHGKSARGSFPLIFEDAWHRIDITIFRELKWENLVDCEFPACEKAVDFLNMFASRLTYLGQPLGLIFSTGVYRWFETRGHEHSRLYCPLSWSIPNARLELFP